MTDEARRPVPAPTGATAAARALFGSWCAAAVAAGAERVELRVELDDPDDGAASIRAAVRVVAPAPLYSWDLSGACVGGWVVDPVGDVGPDDPAAPGPIDDLFAALDALALPVPAAGVTLRGADLLVEAGAVDDTICWDASGGPYYGAVR